MKLAIDERVKHRLVGLAVILSVIAIFLPAILKRTNQPFDTLSRVSVRLPAKPAMPEVKVVEQTKLFNTVKTTHVAVRSVPAPIQVAANAKPVSLVHPSTHIEVAQASLPKMAREASLPRTSVIPPTPKIEKKLEKVVIKAPVDKSRVIVAAKTGPVMNKTLTAKNQSTYAVQVANFSSLKHANGLVQKLKARGFQAHYASVPHPHGRTSYKVLVGHAVKRDEVLRLQHELASQMQIQGFVVKAEVG